jgi:hypothetical protein
VSDQSYLGDGIPDSEGFEHNDLTGNYSGDTGSFSIQDTTVGGGSYALEGQGGQNHRAIIRTTRDEPWKRGGLQIDWQQYVNTDANLGLLVLDAQDVSTGQGYLFQTRDDLDELRIDTWSSGEPDNSPLAQVSLTPTTGSWLTATARFQEDGTIEFETDGESISANNTDHTELYLGFHSYIGGFSDEIQFSEI